MAIRNYTVYDGEKIPHIRGSKGCFVGGTQISMADGSKKAIEDVQLGDLLIQLFKKLFFLIFIEKYSIDFSIL